MSKHTTPNALPGVWREVGGMGPLVRQDIPARTPGMVVLASLSEPYIFDAVIVVREKYHAALTEAVELSKQGVMRLVCVPGQEAIAARWVAARSLDVDLFKVAQAIQ